MKFGIILLSLLVLLLLTAVLPVGGGLSAYAVYTSPMMIVLFALLSIASVRCCIKRKFSAKQSGFYFVHLGVVVILSGAFAGYVAGAKGILQLSLLPPQPEDRVMTATGESIEFGFEVTADDFEVRFYPPVYHLYRQIPPERMVPGEMPFEKVAEFKTDGETVLMLEEFGPFEVSNLWNEARQEWVSRRMLDAGSFLNLASQTPSYFGVTLRVDGKELPVSINHPASCKGWRFYLMSYDQINRSYVQLSARRDPGRNTVVTGIWMMLIGTFVLCFRRTGGA